MDYNFEKDLRAIREILGLSQAEFASRIGAGQVTISRNELKTTVPSRAFLEKVYGFAFKEGIKLGKLKQSLWAEDIEGGHKLLFHGAKNEINGKVDIRAGRANNDFGQGFYTGESYEQAISFVSGFPKSSVYILDFDPEGLKCKRYSVDQEWMFTIACYRGTLGRYSSHPLVKRTVEESKTCDYIIAPIADNRMFQTINSFIDGEITDEQCRHCLAASNLGNQYVFKTDKSTENLKIVEKCYIPDNEKEYYRNVRTSESEFGDDKVKIARIKYRGKGRYIDEILA